MCGILAGTWSCAVLGADIWDREKCIKNWLSPEVEAELEKILPWLYSFALQRIILSPARCELN